MKEKSSITEAEENLLYIRQTLEAAGQLTAVPGWSMVAAGGLALAGAVVNGFVTGTPWKPETDARYPLMIWGGVLVFSLTIVLYGIHRQSRKMQVPIRSPLVRKLLWSLCPSLFAGALLTGLSFKDGFMEWLPVIWLGCYGAAVTSSGMVSVAPVRYMGLCFLLTAAVAAVSTPDLGLLWVAFGFGWLHIVYGAYIARRHND